MIICYEGNPGAGKTYDAVRKIIDNLRLGRKVYTNIDGMGDSAKREYIGKLLGFDDYTLAINFIWWDKTDSRWLDFTVQKKNGIVISAVWTHIELHALVILDEAHTYFSNREWQSETNKAFSLWASTHRHYGFDVVLISQNLEKIDTHVRSIVEWTYRYRKINFFGSLFKNGYIIYAFTGESSGKHLSKHIRKYIPKFYFCYDSYASKDMKEQGIMTHSNVLKHPIFFIIPVMLLVFIFFFMKSGFSKGEIIPGSHHAQELANKTKQAVIKPSQPVPFGKANVVEFRDLQAYKHIPAQTHNMVFSARPNVSDIPVRPIQDLKQKVGSVTIYVGDVVEMSKDIFASKSSQGMGGEVVRPAPHALNGDMLSPVRTMGSISAP